MGIVKISDDLHDELRKYSNVMSRSINSQAEFWLKMGRLAELNPTLTFHEILKQELLREQAVFDHSDSELKKLEVVNE
ncbi:ParD-like family protein [Marinomonas sp. 15G1-11]|uniref:ParD-like family protein n=1 Tax=Marinomonas phaeophyticola TaxID=3004091 RepID=A0ABT4JXP1_9GAMM|nr:ParD-like family protein [Marinomonas sp. 15G1-11]MCZ2723171.1 ParD-like family protein [Marinomonas sp. 15G1-11]